MSNKVLSFGSLNIDTTFSVPHIVNPGETISSLGISNYVGGKGLNQSIALSNAGSKVYHAGAVGDEDGDILVKALKDKEVNVDNVIVKDGLSGNAFIQVDEKGQNSIVLYDGANKKLTINDVEKVLDEFSEGDYLILQNEINMLPEIIDMAYNKGLIIFLNPSPMNAEINKCDLSKVKWFLLNEIEAAQIIGATKYSDNVVDELSTRYPKANFLITLGELGSICFYEDKLYEQEIYNVEVTDTTGAGDTYTGYFISMLNQGHEIKVAMEYASVASGIAVSREGASRSIPLFSEVEEVISEMC